MTFDEQQQDAATNGLFDSAAISDREYNQTPKYSEQTIPYIKSIMANVEEDLDPQEIWTVPDGMAKSVFENKYSRVLHTTTNSDGSKSRTFQTWAQRIKEVVGGNFSLDFKPNGLVAIPDPKKGLFGSSAFTTNSLAKTYEYALRGVLPFAGRHLQQGDWEQKNKTLEKMCNCATALSSFTQFKLGLDGCGIGADYSTAVRRVNWDNAPYIRPVLSVQHPDFHKLGRNAMSLEEAREKYPTESENVRWFDVEDSCEGWVRVIAAIETCLLYTSPSPRDQRGSRMPSSA